MWMYFHSAGDPVWCPGAGPCVMDTSKHFDTTGPGHCQSVRIAGDGPEIRV